MKLPVGTELIAKKDFENFKKKQDVKIDKIIKGEGGKRYSINGITYTKEVIKENFKLKKQEVKEIVKIPVKKKRVLFPWVKDAQGRCYKTALALLAEKKGWTKVITGDLGYIKFLKIIIKKTNSYFPSMYKKVAKFYEEHGRTLSEKDFEPIAIGRISMMFKVIKGENKVERCPEHPLCNGNKFEKEIVLCEKMFKENKTWEDMN